MTYFGQTTLIFSRSAIQIRSKCSNNVKACGICSDKNSKWKIEVLKKNSKYIQIIKNKPGGCGITRNNLAAALNFKIRLLQ